MFVAESPFIVNEQYGKRCANSIERLEEAITSEIEEVTLSKLSKAKKKCVAVSTDAEIKALNFSAVP